MADKYPCIRSGCPDVTNHFSGLCATHRTRECRYCRRVFTPTRMQNYCSGCREKAYRQRDRRAEIARFAEGVTG